MKGVVVEIVVEVVVGVVVVVVVVVVVGVVKVALVKVFWKGGGVPGLTRAISSIKGIEDFDHKDVFAGNVLKVHPILGGPGPCAPELEVVGGGVGPLGRGTVVRDGGRARVSG